MLVGRMCCHLLALSLAGAYSQHYYLPPQACAPHEAIGATPRNYSDWQMMPRHHPLLRLCRQFDCPPKPGSSVS